MKVSEVDREDPFMFCEGFSDRYVHLYIPVYFRQITVCRRIVTTAGFMHHPSKRVVCPKCFAKSGLKRKPIT